MTSAVAAPGHSSDFDADEGKLPPQRSSFRAAGHHAVKGNVSCTVADGRASVERVAPKKRCDAGK